MFLSSIVWILLAQCILAVNDGYWVRIIYKKMGGRTSYFKDGCSIPGVTCSGSKVVEIEWSKKGLSGSIPPEIGKLASLSIL